MWSIFLSLFSCIWYSLCELISRTIPDCQITNASRQNCVQNNLGLCMWNGKRMTHQEKSRIATGSELVERVSSHCLGCCNFMCCS
jgi:hypothetical protein